jgi:hypothetical protein
VSIQTRSIYHLSEQHRLKKNNNNKILYILHVHRRHSFLNARRDAVTKGHCVSAGSLCTCVDNQVLHHEESKC